MDTLATEVLMGRARSDERFYEDLASIMGQTRELARRFVGFSEKLISSSAELLWVVVKHSKVTCRAHMRLTQGSCGRVLEECVQALVEGFVAPKLLIHLLDEQ